MSISMIETWPQNKRSSVAVRPYFEKRDNMGLEKYGLSLFDGAFHEEPVACLESNGVKRYLTGLNEFAPEIKNIEDPIEREERIRQIRIKVRDLEKVLVSNVLDIEDANFWSKVKLLKPDNSDFWDKMYMRCSNDPVFLEPTKDPYDEIKLYVIEAGGFSMVAKSLEEAQKRAIPPKFYLDKVETTASTNTEVSKLRNKAGAELQKLFDKNTNKLFYVAKILDINSAQYRKSTPNDIIYQNMDKYISGDLVDKDKRKTAQRFLDTVNLDMETLKLRAIVKDALYYRIIATKPDGYIYHLDRGALLGRTQADVADYLKIPSNEDILTDLLNKVESYWKQ
jgi:hypothetical protein